MRCSNKTRQNRRAVFWISGLQPQFNVEGIIKEWTFYNQVVRITMKASRIVLIGVAILQRKMRIRVMGHQRVDRQLGRNRQRKERQQPGSEDRSYGPMVDQSSFVTTLQINILIPKIVYR